MLSQNEEPICISRSFVIDVIGPNTAMISLNVLYFKGPLISFRNDYFLIDYTLPDHKIKKVRVFPSYETHKWYGNLDFESVSIQLKVREYLTEPGLTLLKHSIFLVE